MMCAIGKPAFCSIVGFIAICSLYCSIVQPVYSEARTLDYIVILEECLLLNADQYTSIHYLFSSCANKLTAERTLSAELSFLNQMGETPSIAHTFIMN